MRDIDDIKRRFIMLESVYEMPCPPDGFKKLSELFRCDFILGVGLDRAKRMAKGHANTVMTLSAKGILSEHLWISFVLYMFVPSYETLEILANKLLDWSVQYVWIDYIDLEEYQAKDLHAWCEAKGFQAELVTASYKHQMEIFKLAYDQFSSGLCKCPAVNVWMDEGDRLYYQFPPEAKDDIFRFELAPFEHVPNRDDRRSVGYFGSSYKRTGRKIGEPRDDTVYSWAHSLFAANRGSIAANAANVGFASVSVNQDAVGEYGQQRLAKSKEDPDGIVKTMQFARALWDLAK